MAVVDDVARRRDVHETLAVVGAHGRLPAAHGVDLGAVEDDRTVQPHTGADLGAPADDGAGAG